MDRRNTPETNSPIPAQDSRKASAGTKYIKFGEGSDNQPVTVSSKLVAPTSETQLVFYDLP